MLKIYNTLSRKKEVFRPKKGKTVRLFVCGPTVYDSAHLGHARTYITFDFIAKYLKTKGYKVFYLQNITDLDDKIIQRAEEKNTTPKELAARFEKAYLKNMEDLKVNSVTEYARATAHIREIIGQITALQKKGFAYQTRDGIYYDIGRFKDYGKLSRRTVLQAEDAVSRIDESREKRNKGDFCLWKTAKPGEPSWPAPFGRGRPGWHIEDTAIAEKFFGAQYDMHGGGQDLVFPHHEAEIAQMEGISGKKPMAKYWLHTGFLRVGGQKMSKSLGNFITIDELLKKHSYPYIRFFVLKNLYRSPMDFNEDFFRSAQGDLEYVWETKENLEKLKKTNFKCQDAFSKSFSLSLKTFEAAMENDFNTPEALGTVFSLLGRCNSLMNDNRLTSRNADDVLAFLKKIDEFFNFIFWEKSDAAIPPIVSDLLREREKYRQERNWPKADEIRKKLAELGWQIEDTKQGSSIKKIFS